MKYSHRKPRKAWSINANRKKARLRIERGNATMRPSVVLKYHSTK